MKNQPSSSGTKEISSLTKANQKPLASKSLYLIVSRGYLDHWIPHTRYVEISSWIVQIYISQIGKNFVPSAIQSEDEAEGSSYDDPQLKAALSNAYPRVLQIITGTVPHPIMDFIKDVALESTGTKIDQAVNFHRSHPIPTLPSDSTLVTPHLQKLIGEVGVVPDRDLLIFGVAKVLFELVIIRSYLGLNPAHDAHIYEAWSQKLLCRRSTPEERALEACRTD